MIADKNVWETFMLRLINLEKKYPFVRLDFYGFTNDWKQILGINSENNT